MSKSQWEAQEKLELLASLDALLGCMKSLHTTVGAVMADVAAIRSAFFDDPEELAEQRSNIRKAVMARRGPNFEDSANSYEDLIRQIADSQGLAN
jgi:hypothetical protein